MGPRRAYGYSMIGPVITGILASTNADMPKYFTSALYPIEIEEDAISIRQPTIDRGYILPLLIEDVTIGIPTIINASLTETINYLTWAPTSGMPVDEISIGAPSMNNFSLTETIRYMSYAYDDSDAIGILNPDINSETLI